MKVSMPQRKPWPTMVEVKVAIKGSSRRVEIVELTLEMVAGEVGKGLKKWRRPKSRDDGGQMQTYTK